jgi:hypothetical protein
VHPGASATKLFARQLEQAGRGLLAPVEWQHLPMRVSRQCSSAAQRAVGIVVTHEQGAVRAASRRLFCFRTKDHAVDAGTPVLAAGQVRRHPLKMPLAPTLLAVAISSRFVNPSCGELRIRREYGSERRSSRSAGRRLVRDRSGRVGRTGRNQPYGTSFRRTHNL